MLRLIKKIGVKFAFVLAIILAVSFYAFWIFKQKDMLNKVIERLSADSRVAEILVTNVEYDPEIGAYRTTIKFLEYDTGLNPLEPKYFTFSNNLIQFQSLVIRFDDFYVRNAHPLKGKSAYIFMKAFSLKKDNAEVYEINKVKEIPSGYEVEGAGNMFEKRLWQKFWDYALDAAKSKRTGIKNAQIEAPGTKFILGQLYTIKIEHDGGLRIDCQELPKILKGETVRF